MRQQRERHHRALSWWVTPASTALVVVVLAVGALGACTSGSSFDRAAAVDAVEAQGGGRITRSQAECYVDRVRDEVGVAPLAPGYVAPADLIPKLTDIRIDCVGVTNLGTSPPATVDPDLSLRDALPNHPGDDPALDALYDACGAGDGAACDRLFDQAPVGSEYETFASTCGGRRAELACGPPTTTVPAPDTTTATTGAAPP